jgi:hypothetical protein
MSLIVTKPDEPRIVKDWPVVVPTALDGGKIRKDEMFVDYQVLPQDEIDDIIKAAQESGENYNIALMRRVVKSINGKVDQDNKPIEFNDESLSESLRATNQLSALVGAFFDVQNGRKPARKN